MATHTPTELAGLENKRGPKEGQNHRKNLKTTKRTVKN